MDINGLTFIVSASGFSGQLWKGDLDRFGDIRSRERIH
jgi:hypothetical protein